MKLFLSALIFASIFNSSYAFTWKEGTSSLVHYYSSKINERIFGMSFQIVDFKDAEATDKEERALNESMFCISYEDSMEAIEGFVSHPELKTFRLQFPEFYSHVDKFLENNSYETICSGKSVIFPTETTKYQEIEGLWSSVSLSDRKKLSVMKEARDRLSEFADELREYMDEDRAGEDTTLFHVFSDFHYAKEEAFFNVLLIGSDADIRDMLFSGNFYHFADKGYCNFEYEVIPNENGTINFAIRSAKSKIETFHAFSVNTTSTLEFSIEERNRVVEAFKSSYELVYDESCRD